jgi:hypothetical protein
MGRAVKIERKGELKSAMKSVCGDTDRGLF